MIVKQFSTLDQAWLRTIDLFIKNEPGIIDKAWSPRLFSFNNLLRAKSADFDFDFSWVGLTRPRWARFLHGYVDREDLVEFLDKVRVLRRGAEVGLYTRRDTDHAWGSCLMGVTFMGAPNPHVSMFSRTSSLAQTGVVDLAFAHVIAREAGRISGLRPDQISVNWYVSSLFVSALHIIPYLTYAERITEIMENHEPGNQFCIYTQKLFTKYFDKRLETKYGPTNRMIARHDSINAGTLASVPIESLDLQPVLTWKGAAKERPRLREEDVDDFDDMIEEVA